VASEEIRGADGDLTQWPAAADDLVRLQRRLAELADEAEGWRPPDRPLLVAAAFCAFPTGRPGPGAAGDPACAAAVLWRESRSGAGEARGRGEVVSRAVVLGEAGAAYEAGLLALRAGPLLAAALAGLEGEPDVLLLDATGRDHPRRAGLTLHVGAALGLPSAGVTNRILAARAESPGEAEGSVAPILLDEECVGWALRSRAGVNPVLVHAGWRTGPDTALAVVRRLIGHWRTPEPLRLARHDARVARAEAEGRLR
jgi:deoxyribonuclease V